MYNMRKCIKMHKYQSPTNLWCPGTHHFGKKGAGGVVAAGGEGTFVAGNPTISVLSPSL